MANLYYTVGAPRSGKSTYIKQSWDFLNYTHVCVDNFRLAVYGKRWWREGESAAYAHAYLAARALLKTGNNVVYDDTNTSETSLRRIWEIDPDAKPIVILTSTEVCKERAVATSQEDLFPVIERCNERLQSQIYNLKDLIRTTATNEKLLCAYFLSMFKVFDKNGYNDLDVIELTIEALKIDDPQARRRQ